MRDRIWRSVVGGATVLACSLGHFALAAPPDGAVPPIVPGYLRLKNEARVSDAEGGEVLLGELNCLQCHNSSTQKRVFTKGAPDLSEAGARLTPQFIREFISDPHHAKPGTTMPDLFHASEEAAKTGAVDYLTHYLVSLGKGPIKASAEEGNSVSVGRGKALYHQIGCVACHTPEAQIKGSVPSVPFPNLAEKNTVESLQAFLLNPTQVRPGSRMPSLNLSREEARDIAIYLLRDQLENPQSKSAAPARTGGLQYIYYEVNAHTAAVDKIDPLKSKSKGKVEKFTLDIPNHRKENFAVKFSGAIHIPRDGKYKFYTSSDDGSRLYINGQLVVDNDGVHPASEKGGEVNLIEGDQPIVVTYFQNANDAALKVQWEGPQIRKAEIPADVLFSVGGQPMVPLNSENFVVDAEKARMGAMMFSAIGCVSCHNVPGAPARMKTPKALADLNAESPTGCLGDQIPKTVPNYHFDPEQRKALAAAVKNVKELDKPLEPKQEAAHLAAAFNCFACHVRDNAGGPPTERTSFFVMTAEFDMGDEGRFPPRLTNAGAKLTPAAMEQIICENKLHVRPVLATRMPSFSKEKVEPMIQALASADASAPKPAPAFDAIATKEGRTLFGTRGMGCVNCHGVNGVKLQGVMPAPDLTTVHDRLRYSWFRELLADPAHVNPGTRMPAFWANGDVAFKNLAGGTMDSQIAAIWSYLSLGPSMALPAGLNPSGGHELVPTDEPIVHRTFLSGAGNRSIAVGYPEMIHVAFDADVVRLAMAWKGRFFDAKGMWEGRGGQHLGPLGTDVIDLPPGPSFAVLGSANAEWPLPKPTYHAQVERNLGGHFKGYVLDKQERPTFEYILNEVTIQEQPLPVLKAGGAELQRKFHAIQQTARRRAELPCRPGQADRSQVARRICHRWETHRQTRPRLNRRGQTRDS